MGNFQLEAQGDSPPPYSQHAPIPPEASPAVAPQQLVKPIVIPATTASLGSPFLRAYPPNLDAFNISREDFLGILDGLNRVAVQSPPLLALGLVGEVLGVVPIPTAQLVGFAVSTASQIGKYALSKGATEAYLRKVNKEIFGPRGLKMEIAKLEAMARVNKLPILDSQGKLRDDMQLLRPIIDAQEMQSIGAAQRWLQALEPWVAPLELEYLPPINMETTSFWGKLHTKASEHERKSAEKKLLKNRDKIAEKHQKEVEKAEEKRAKDLAKIERKEQRARDSSRSHRVDSKLQKIDQKREKAERKHDERIEKADEDSTSKDKEAKSMTKVLWLIIRGVGEDSGIADSFGSGEDP
ncbi:hypothetical protein F5Y08DRAFT_319687 [Xylaria arbuscula]|nr:hypothetical protein F5Y08DRAFT_319687 [Xylaria arbuscula]